MKSKKPSLQVMPERSLYQLQSFIEDKPIKNAGPLQATLVRSLRKLKTEYDACGLKLSTEDSPIQSFDSKDLETCLGQNGRGFLGPAAILFRNVQEMSE